MKKENKKQLQRTAPKDLERLIQHVRKVPLDIFLPLPDPNIKDDCVLVLQYADKTFDISTYGINGKDAIENWVHQTRRNLKAQLEDLEEDFQRYIWETDDLKTSSVKEFVDPQFYQWANEKLNVDDELFNLWRDTVQATLKYEDFYNLHRQFKLLVSIFNVVMVSERSPKELSLKFHKGEAETSKALQSTIQFINSHLIKLPNSIKYEIDDHGLMRVRLDEFSQVIQGVDVTRIRECQWCHKVFWAERLDAVCCAKGCRNSYHVDRSNKKRANNPSYAWEQDMKRRANLRAKKELEQIGYKAEDVEAYQRKNRKYPHRVIYDFLVQECLKPETKSSPEYLEIPKRLIQHLSKFIRST